LRKLVGFAYVRHRIEFEKKHTNFVTFEVFLVSFGSKEGEWGDGNGTQVQCEIVVPKKVLRSKRASIPYLSSKPSAP
jgi:hypothetical protein